MSSADAPVPARPAGSASFTIAGFAIGKLEIALGLNAAAFIVARLSGVSLLLELLLLGAVIALGSAIAVKLLRNTIRQLIWRLRNRLIVAYVFIGVIPVLAMLALVGATSQYLGGQVGAYLVHSELERRLTALNAAARSLAEASPDRRPMLLDRVESFYRERFPNLTAIVADEARTPPEAPSRDWGEIHGIVVKDGLLYAWARAIHEQTQVTLLAPLTRRWLADLTPDLGGVSVVHFPDPDAANRRRQPLTMRPHPPAAGEEDDPAVIPPPVNRFDVELLGGSNLPVALWESPQVLERSLLAVHSRLSAVLHILFEQKQPVEAPLYFFAALFLIAEIISVYIGVSITRTITGAVHDLYEGTERVMRGDFSHRIPVRGKEQIAELSSSFNRMTENLEHLLEVAKEKERMQAELEIAREVQNQLFPRSVPALKCLELRAMCKPARMVSGDYYDYPLLSDGRIAIALGDVAGKGI